VTEPGRPPLPQPGLRERHKITTRRALEDAALALFARDGFDATPVEAVAEAARVSPRTFHRYFSAKEEVLDMGWPERRERLLEATLAVEGDTDLTVAAVALRVVAADFEGERDRVRLRARATATSAALRGRTADTLGAWEAALAEGLARRRDLPQPDAAATVAAAAAMAVWRTAVGWWLTGRGDVPLGEQVRRAFAAL